MRNLLIKRFWFLAICFGLATVGMSLTGCSKKQTIRPNGGGGGYVSEQDINSGRATSDNGDAMGLETIHFPFNSSELNTAEIDILKHDVQVMKDNPSVHVQIEGNCDERGGIQYNLALGERRANSIARRMIARGISRHRITTISLGKEKPIDPGHNEAAWAKNRRGNFVITSR